MKSSSPKLLGMCLHWDYWVYIKMPLSSTLTRGQTQDPEEAEQAAAQTLLILFDLSTQGCMCPSSHSVSQACLHLPATFKLFSCLCSSASGRYTDLVPLFCPADNREEAPMLSCWDFPLSSTLWKICVLLPRSLKTPQLS